MDPPNHRAWQSLCTKISFLSHGVEFYQRIDKNTTTISEALRSLQSPVHAVNESPLTAIPAAPVYKDYRYRLRIDVETGGMWLVLFDLKFEQGIAA